jgi:hypothetical protein
MSEKTDLQMQVLDLNSALNILIQGVQIGQKAGIYNFQDSASIYQAIYSIQTIAKKTEEKQKKQKELKEKAVEVKTL